MAYLQRDVTVEFRSYYLMVLLSLGIKKKAYVFEVKLSLTPDEAGNFIFYFLNRLGK